jgi:hypothetical protein
MTLAWLAPPEWQQLLERSASWSTALYGWFDRRPYEGGEDTVWIARRAWRERLGSLACGSGSPAVVVLLVLALVLLYNRLVRLRNRVENAWAQVDVQLRRRYDLIPNLVETVKGYAAHERGTFEAVTEARTRRSRRRASPQQAPARTASRQALGRLFAVAEAYPSCGERELPAPAEPS